MSDTSLVFTILGKDKSGAALNSASQRMDKLKRSAMVGFGLVAGAVGVSVAKAASFDKTIRQVGAASGETGAGLQELSKLALKMGADTSFSASQASQAMLELSKTGMTAAEIKGGALAHTLTMAAAGEIELGTAAGYMANALAAFSLKAEDAGQVAAALAGGAQASTASVDSLAQGLGNVGAVAKQAGYTVQDTVAVLAMFDQSAIKGAEGGTQLKTMLLALNAPSEVAAKQMKKLGFSARDSSGQLKPLGQIADELKSKLSGMGAAQRDAAMKTIFGKYAISGANILLEKGSKKLSEYKDAALDMAAAQKMADTNTSGAAGAFEQFQGAVETLQLSVGLLLLPAVTAITKGLTKMVNYVTNKVAPAFDALKGLADKLAPAFGKVRDKISDAFSGVDFSGLGKKLQEDASKWSTDLMAGLQQGFDSGDWSGLGKSIASGLGGALSSSGDLAITFFAWIGSQMKRINWVGLGVAMGKQAPLLLAGLAIGILNFDLGGLLRGLGDHWFEVILGVLTIAFLPAKLIGAITKLLGKIPFAGKLLAWGVNAIHKGSRGLAKAGGRLFVDFASGAIRSLSRTFPRLGNALEKGLVGLVHVLTRGAPKIGAAVGKWGTKMLSALGRVPGRLAARGGEMVGGLLSGLFRSVGKLDGWLGGWGGRMVAKVGNLGSALFQAGKDFVGGFTRGVLGAIPNALGAVGGLAKRAGSALKDRLLMRSPSRLTMQYGRFFSSGFAIGIKDGTKDVVEKAKALVDKLKEKLQVVKDFAADIKATFATLADVTSIDTLLMGENGDSEGGFGTLLAKLQGRAADAAAFERGMSSLRSMGLNETTLSQLREAGPEGGLKSMQQILGAGAGGVGQVNEAVKAILRSGSTFANREAHNRYGIDPSKAQKIKVTVGGNVKLTVDPGGLLKVLRQEIRAQGGDVQKVLGKAK